MDRIEVKRCAVADKDAVDGEIAQSLGNLLILAGLDVVIFVNVGLLVGEIFSKEVDIGSGEGLGSLIDGDVGILGNIVALLDHGGHGDELVGASGAQKHLSGVGSRRGYGFVVDVNYRVSRRTGAEHCREGKHREKIFHHINE